jgi:hypothetical protein
MIQRMWEGGPLRQFSDSNTRPKGKGSWMAYSSPILTGWTGSYVCDECRVPVAGVYRVVSLWLCSGCREKMKVRKPQPVGLARYQEERVSI